MAIIPEQPYIQPLNRQWYQPYVDAVDMLRLDVVHPVVSGNKWYKLKWNVAHALQDGYDKILTFGGAYSNHLVAAAATAATYNIQSVGVVKGTYAEKQWTPTLQACADYGMQLHFVSHEEYAQKETTAQLESLSEKFGAPFIIPEGGANAWGREGAAEIAAFIPEGYTHICLSVGTGTTLAGIYDGLKDAIKVWGYAPMKGGIYLQEEVQKHIEKSETKPLTIYDNWHFGGFGKSTDDHISFMNAFYEVNSIPLDMVYTGKMMFGLQQQLAQGIMPENARILCIHTGGLQGNSTIQDRLVY